MARARKTRVVDDHWRRRALPVLDVRRCTGCGWCASICPVDCLAMAAGLPWLVRPVACVSCGLCGDVCPADAIAMMGD